MDTNYFLSPCSYTHQKSFYNKALVIQEGQNIKLRSYSTTVAEYNMETQKLSVYGEYSPTTKRHIRAFINNHTKFSCPDFDTLREFIRLTN